MPFPQGQNATCIIILITCNSYDQITLAMHVHSDFVTNSYSESSGSSREKSCVPVHQTELTIAVLDYILEICTVVN